MRLFEIEFKSDKIMEIERIAKWVRSENVECYADDILQGACLPVSRRLRNKLIEEGFSDAMVVQGTFMVDEPHFHEDDGEEIYELLHYWVETQGLLVDITQTQFEELVIYDELEEIFITKIESAERYTPLRKGWK